MAMEKLGLNGYTAYAHSGWNEWSLRKAGPALSSLLLSSVRASPAGLECTVVRGKHIGHTSEAASTQPGDKCLCKTVLLSAADGTGVNQKEKCSGEHHSQTNEH